jgi:tRNA wybutosine-synthesizing protein 3
MTFSVAVDKSPQGFIDDDIIPLLTILNKKFETTSSCSGRITLMRGVRKGVAKWIYKTHETAEAKAVFEELQKLGDGETLRFLYEPFIIHLKCKDFAEVSWLLGFLHGNGLKKSGMISGKNLIVEINDSGKIEMLMNKTLSFEYVSLMVEEANRRLLSTKEKIRRLEQLFA